MLLHGFEHPSWVRVMTLLVLTTQEEEEAALLLGLVLVLLVLIGVEKLELLLAAPPAGLAQVGNLAGKPGPPMAGLASRLRQVKQPVRSEAYSYKNNCYLINYMNIYLRNFNITLDIDILY